MDHSPDAVGGRSAEHRPPTERARLLLEINNQIVSHLDLAQVLKGVSDCLRREIKHDFAGLALYDSDRRELRLHALDFPDAPDFMKKGQLIPLVGTPASLAFASRKPVLRHRPDFEEFPAEIMKQAYARGIRSGCAVPLLYRDKIVGSMVLASLRESAFTEDDVDLLAQIGAQVAIAVDNALNYERLRCAECEVVRERDRTQLLLEINNAVVSHLDLRDLVKSISTSLRRIIPHDGACFSLLEAGDKRMRIQALDALHLEGAPFKEGIESELDGTPEGEAILSGRAVLVTPRIDLERFHNPWVRKASEQGVQSGCAVPLIAHGRTLGALSVVSMREDAFNKDHAQLLTQCSGQIAIAVENSLNFEKSRRAEHEATQERDRSHLLLNINNALVSHLDLSALVKAISTSLQRVVQHDCVGLAIHDAESGKMFSQAVSSKLEPMHEGIYFDPAGTVSGLTFKTGRPVYMPTPDAVQFPSAVTKGFFDRGLRSLYAVPVCVHGRLIGVMSISSVREDGFSANDREVFGQVANQVAIAAANAIAVRELEALKDKLAQEKLYLEDEIRTELNFDEIVGQSPALRQVLKLVETVASSDSTVLLLGETGTGKELIARAVHDHSRRKARTFVKLNCAAIPTGLLESELFGHEKGAFTGAIAQKIGRLELADQGTLFLDEVGDIPPEIQPKLLRALQEREFERLGSTYTKKVNVRLVAATNRDLEKMTETREFRSDLYYRLNVFPIRIPPLRERQEDIPLLVRYFAEKFARQMQKPIESIPVETMNRLQQWHWPGNVRELENLIERAVIMTAGTALDVPLPEVKLPQPPPPSPRTSNQVDGAERDLIIKALRESRGILAGPNGAATRLGLKRTTLQYKLKKFAIEQHEWWPKSS
jgi:formate hydrogenlyase transcriptional activator